MEIKNILRKYCFLTLLAFLATVLVFWRFFFQQRESLSPGNSGQLAVPTPSLIPSPTPTLPPERGNPNAQKEIIERTVEQYPLIRYVPYDGENFYLDYLGPLKLGVKIRRGELSEVKWQVYDWLRDKGVEPDSHEIVWLEE